MSNILSTKNIRGYQNYTKGTQNNKIIKNKWIKIKDKQLYRFIWRITQNNNDKQTNEQIRDGGLSCLINAKKKQYLNRHRHWTHLSIFGNVDILSSQGSCELSSLSLKCLSKNFWLQKTLFHSFLHYLHLVN